MGPDFPSGLWAVASDSAWHHMFGLGLSVFEKTARPVFVYAALVVGLRVFGKRELAQLNPFDFVVLMSLANTVQNAIIGADDSLVGGLIGALALLSVNYLVVRFLFAHRRLARVLKGSAVALIEHGRVVHKALAREMITPGELKTVLHRQGFHRIEEVERCVLEPGGTFAVEGKGARQAEVFQRELLERLDRLERQIEALRTPAAAAVTPAVRPDDEHET